MPSTKRSAPSGPMPDHRPCREVTAGAAITALKGAEGLPEGEPLLFNDCDHLFLCKSFYDFCAEGQFAQGPAGALLTFESDSPAYSYLQYGRRRQRLPTRWKSRWSAMTPSAGPTILRTKRPTPDASRSLPARLPVQGILCVGHLQRAGPTGAPP